MFPTLEIILVLMACLIMHAIRSRKSWKVKLPPGPWGLPIVGYLPFLGTMPCVTIANLSKTWGPIFTLNLGQHPVVFINDYEKIKEIYKLDTMTGRFQLELFEKRGIYGVGLLEGEQWKEVRRFLLKCLRDFGFGKRSMESSIMEEVNQAIVFIRQKCNEPMYLKPLIELAVVNALWFLMTSEKYSIEDPKKRKVTEIMSEGISDQNLVGIATFLPWFAKLFPNYSGYNKGLAYFGAPEELVAEIVSKHVESYSCGNEADFIDHTLTKIYETEDPDSMFYKDIGMKNLHYTLIDMFFAGSDTLSSTLGWTFLYLSIWPEKQRLVFQEIKEVVGLDKSPSLKDRERMPYTEATMNEVMRKSSMVPLGLLHTNLEDLEYDTFHIPKGTIFLSNLYHVLQDPEYWGDPEIFRPERFLTLDGKFRKDERMIPFFTGKRSCPGESLAMVQYFLFFTGILQKFEFALNPAEGIPYIGPRAEFILPPPKHTLLIHERKNV